jgi:hypothetical protein
MKFQNKITNNFNNEVIYTTVRTKKDLAIELRTLAREQGKEITDYKITKI